MKQEPRTLDLVQPIQSYGETLTQLVFRPPNGKDIRECGNPIDMLSPKLPMGKRVDDEKLARMIETLCAIPSSSVNQIGLTDWQACGAMVMSFLEAPARKSSTATTKPPASGATSDTSST